jgi:hypothetical protein
VLQSNEECDVFDAIYGNNWIEIEYTDVDNAAQVFEDACSARGNRISVIQRDRDVVPSKDGAYSYKLCSDS